VVDNGSRMERLVAEGDAKNIHYVVMTSSSMKTWVLRAEKSGNEVVKRKV
jgi:hypothetical protein